MAELSNDGGYGTVQGTIDGKSDVVEPVFAYAAVGEATLHLLVKAGLLHLVLPGTDAGKMVGFVEVHENVGGQEADNTEGTAEAERPEKKRMRATGFCGTDNGTIQNLGQESDGQVGGQEMGLIQTMVKETQAHDGEA